MNRKETQGGFLSPKMDVVFKELMRNEGVRKGFISDVLAIPLEEIKSVRLENTFLSRRGRKEKQCVLDVRMLLNDNRRINVEMQIRRLDYWDKRSLYYLAKMYTDALFVGHRYDKLKKCIVINILDFDWDTFPDYHKVYGLRDQKGRLYSDQFEVHIIEMNKELTGDRLDDWIRLFRVESREELEKMQSGNAGVMKAVEEVRAMNLCRRAKLMYEEHLKNQRDLWAMEDFARKEGHAEGRAEGREEGHAEGRAEGRTEGHAEGRTEGELRSRRQVIYDFLGRLGDIPQDIRQRVDAEENVDTLRRWYMKAPGVSSFDEFREVCEK